MTLLERLKQGESLFESDEDNHLSLQEKGIEFIQKLRPNKKYSVDSYEIPREDEHQESYVK